MKKIYSLFILGVLFLMSSCAKKDFTCECQEEGSPIVVPVIYHETTKRTAKDKCVSYTYESASGQVKVNCKLK